MGVCVETLRVNGMTDGYLRPMVFIGEGAMGIYAPHEPGRRPRSSPGSGARTWAKRR